MLYLYDQSGLGYVPPGVIVTIYPLGAAQLPGNVTASAMVGVGGALNVTIAPGENYVATFSGAPSQAPRYSAAFASNGDGSPTSVIVPSFGSTVLSAGAYADQLRNVHYPIWLGDEVDTPIANNWFAAIGGLLADIDTSAQIERTAMRLQSCTGGYIDSFFRDLFGGALPRITGETDVLYLTRGMVFTNRIRMTLACITAVVQTYIASIVNLPQGGPGLALDNGQGGLDSTSGALDTTPPAGTAGPAGTQNNLGFDSTQGSLDSTRGALDNAQVPSTLPTAYVFDVQSDPTSSAAISLQDGEVAVYFKYDGYTNTPEPMTSPDPLLIYFVNIVKRCGSKIVYVTNKY